MPVKAAAPRAPAGDKPSRRGAPATPLFEPMPYITMRTLFSIPRILFVLLLAIAVPEARGQNAAVLNLLPDSKLWIEGTSNNSDWTVHATEFKGTLRAPRASAEALDVQEVTVSVATPKIVSNRSTIMDRLIHETLKAEEHPTIEYKLTKADVAKAGNGYTLNTQGSLTLAGVTKPVAMVVTGEPAANGQMRFKGSYAFKFTDFEITPPSAMFGALRVADEVTVHFDVVAAPAR